MGKNSLKNEIRRKISILVDKFHTFILRADKLYSDIDKGKYRKTNILLIISSIAFPVLGFTLLLAYKKLIDVDIFDYKFKLALAITFIFNQFFLVMALIALYILSAVLKFFFPLETELKSTHVSKNERLAEKIVVIMVILFIIFGLLFIKE